MRHILLSLLFIFILNASAKDLPVHCDNDKAIALQIMDSLRVADMPLGDKILKAATMFAGAPEDHYYTEDSVAGLRINLKSFSPLMFVNTAIALAKASEYPGVADFNNFSREFENISTRRGEYTGFPSIMFHTSDWIGDNSARGNIRELTEDYAGVVARTKSLDEMTRYRSNFAALKDSAIFESVRMIEMGFRTHRIPTLKKETIKKTEITEDLKNGDIVILVPNRDGIDCYDIGIVEIKDGLPYFLHLSPQTHAIQREKEDMARYMGLMTKHFQGYRILRVKE